MIFFRDEPPAYLGQWREGAEGARLTAKELDRLDLDVWRVLHDVQLPGRKANLDHVVVGPAGVFLIETKNWTGYVEVVDGVPVQRRRHDREAGKSLRPVAREATGRAVELHRHLAAHNLATWVTAVVVPWADLGAEKVTLGKAEFVAGPSLVTWLLERPHRFRAADSDAVIAATSGAPFPKSFPTERADTPPTTA